MLMDREIHKSALIAPAIVILNFVLSPDFLAVLPDKYSHLGYAFATIIAILFPSLLKKKVQNDDFSGVNPPASLKSTP